MMFESRAAAESWLEGVTRAAMAEGYRRFSDAEIATFRTAYVERSEA